MGDTLVRFLVVAAVLSVALGVAGIAHQLSRLRAGRAPLSLEGLEGRVLFFTDSQCTRCDVVRAHLDALSADYVEIPYDQEPETHQRVGVTGVPLLVVRDREGREVRRFAGVISKARLSAALWDR